MQENYENTVNPYFEEEELKKNAKIKVIGIGGGGSNAVNGMLDDKADQVDYWIFNTDVQDLSASRCYNKKILGRQVTKGLGAGGNPEVGRQAALASADDIRDVIDGADMVFIACGEGGGTGTGGAPVVAQIAHELGCLVLGIVTQPFNFEGNLRRDNALAGINELKKYADALIVVSNDKLVFNNGDDTLDSAFTSADNVLREAVKTITDIILIHGKINLDFADVKSVLAQRGMALIGMGYGNGEKAAVDAVKSAINSPLLESSITGARAMIVNFTCGPETKMNQIQAGIDELNLAAHGDNDTQVNLIFGMQIEQNWKDKVKVAIIATDFDKNADFSSAPLRNDVPKRTQVAENVEPKEQKKPAETNDSFLPNYLRKVLHPEIHSAPVVQEEKPVAEEKTAEVIKPEEEIEIEEEPTVILNRPKF